MRQIIGIFDEYTSRENGKNVHPAPCVLGETGVLESRDAAARLSDSSRRSVEGPNIKKRLDIDPVEAELVRLIFRPVR